jgi:hypothetical protein
MALHVANTTTLPVKVVVSRIKGQGSSVFLKFTLNDEGPNAKILMKATICKGVHEKMVVPGVSNMSQVRITNPAGVILQTGMTHRGEPMLVIVGVLN